MKKNILIFGFGLLTGSTVSSQTLSNLSLLQKNRVDKGTIDVMGSFPQDLYLSFTIVNKAGDDSAAAQARVQQELKNWKDVVKYVQDNPDAYARLWKSYSTLRNAVSADKEGGSIDAKVLAYSLWATQSRSNVNAYLQQYGITDETAINDIDGYINTINRAIELMSNPTVAIFATGNVRGLATNDSPEPTTTGTGSLGATYASTNHVISAQFNVASTLDTSRSGFGSVLLSPLNGRSLSSAIVEWYPRVSGERKWAHLYMSFAGALWQVQKDSIYRNASMNGIGFLYHYRMFEGSIGETSVGLDGEIGLATRWLNGDVRNLLNNDIDKAKYLSVFPTERGFFYGFEGGLSINFVQVIGALQAYYLFPKSKETIDGLTGLQISVGLSVRGDIIRSFLGSKD